MSAMLARERYFPGGVAEHYRLRSPDGPLVVKSALGGTVTLAHDNQEYADFRMGYGPTIIGYRDQRIDTAVCSMIMGYSTTAGATTCPRLRPGLGVGSALTGIATDLEVEVAELVCSLCPHIERIRYANSGTEAVMGAVRCARGFTGRWKIAILEGCYHGLNDEVMWRYDETSHGAGVSPSSKDQLEFLAFNDIPGLDELFARASTELACVLVEPIMGNSGSLSPKMEWLQHLRELCTRHGVLLVFDEVKTGFRVAKGGAQALLGVNADITCLAKSIANGYPIAAIGGTAAVMDVLAEKVVQGGTYTANTMSLAAAKATLEIISQTDAIDTIKSTGTALISAVTAALTKVGVKFFISGPPSMFCIFPLLPNAETDGVKSIENVRDLATYVDVDYYARFAKNLFDTSCVVIEPSPYEPWFICEAHSRLDIDDLSAKIMKSALAATDTSVENTMDVSRICGTVVFDAADK
jgi:glutamate-1-semialdehyde 2,1-aminomutase